MNRPLWLDLFFLAALFAPPTLLAAVGAFVLTNWLELPGWAAVAAYAALGALAILLCVIGLVVWTRIRSPRAEK
jgi:hypothetical protein